MNQTVLLYAVELRAKGISIGKGLAVVAGRTEAEALRALKSNDMRYGYYHGMWNVIRVRLIGQNNGTIKGNVGYIVAYSGYSE